MSIKRSKLDAIFSDLVRERAGQKSEFSGQTGHLECCHIYGRRKKSVRWHPWNAVCLTHYEHRHFTENPLAFADWCERTFGAERMKALRELANTPVKFTPRQIEGLYLHYKEEHRMMLNLRRAIDAVKRIEFTWPDPIPEAEPRKKKKPAKPFSKTFKRRVDGTVVKREMAA